MNERVVPKMTNSHVAKLSNSPAITQHREVPVPRRQDVDERPCVPRLELNGPALRHFESQPNSLRINQRFLNFVPREQCKAYASMRWLPGIDHTNIVHH